MTLTHHIITSLASFYEIYPQLLSSNYIAVDTETDGLRIDRKAVGVSFSINKHTGYYIPLLIWQGGQLVCPWNPSAYDELLQRIQAILTRKKRLVLHNAVFDARVFQNLLDINIIPYVWCDTMLLAHTTYNEEGPLGLKPLAAALVDPKAADAQNDVKESVKANGGSITKTNFEMYKCDYKILGKYAAYDTIYTYAIFEKLYPELQKQHLVDLWDNEVMPLLQVSYELNNNGIRVNVPYFENLKTEIAKNIERIETEVLDRIGPQLINYELVSITKDVKITPRSELGKILLSKHGKLELNCADSVATAVNWYKQKHSLKQIFNFDSADDKAFLIYDLLDLPVEKRTGKGKPATDAATLEDLCERYKDNSPLISKLLERSKEKKLLSTYVESILEHHVNGRIYTGFNQVGTLSGRFSSSRPINLQTLPRDDKRIKAGFIPEPGCVFIGDDFSSLEPRCFAVVSGAPGIKAVFHDNLDFYSKLAIDMFQVPNVSARESDANFLKKVDPIKRQQLKAIALAIPYGAGAGRISQLLGISMEEAQELIDLYMETYPELKQWMDDSEEQAITTGKVRTLTGRVRRTTIVNNIYRKTGMTHFTRKNINNLLFKYKNVEGYEDAGELFYACRNALNNSKNAQIQGLAASVINAAMIEFYQEAKKRGLRAKLILMIHDEIVLCCPKEESAEAAALLQQCMEDNRVTRMLDVGMIAEPVISEVSLAEAK